MTTVGDWTPEADLSPEAGLGPDSDTILPLLPLSSGVVLPGMSVAVGLETDEARVAADAAEAAGGSVLLVPKVGARYASVGTIARIEERRQLRGGLPVVAVTGMARARIGRGVPGTGSAVWVSVEPVVPDEPSGRATELARQYRAVVENILDQRGASELTAGLRQITDPGLLADTAAWSPDLSFEQKVELLETLDVEDRLERALSWMKDVLADLSLRERIRRDVAEGMERSQREFLLRQQLDAIRKELGQGGEEEDAIADYRRRADEAGLVGPDAPEELAKAIERELGRLERTPEQNPEHGWIRSYLDTVLELPWNVHTPEVLDLERARAVLDADHHGLGDVKDRIVEFLAVRKLRGERGLAGSPATTGRRGNGAILALVGPPGVGKTSLGESVARALGRNFARVALGGTHDEAEIRGHRRTYVGAAPGRIVRALREAGSMNPVIVLDEVDKVGADWRGDPSAALLEVLDPAQNHRFRDRYLEVELDLSEVLFIATANVADTIPGPLLDRLEVIRIDGYTEEEKVAIARDHLLGRQLAAQGLRADEVVVEADALAKVIADYTREAGVRALERELGRLLRKVATRIASGDQAEVVEVGADDVATYLGRPRFFFEPAERTAAPGVATGLAVTGAGGDVLFVEATAMDGDPGLAVTGQLGDVMRESAEIALSFVRSHADSLGLAEPDRAFAGRRFHLHVPAGAVPKDGPSAGVTMVTALVSLLTGRLVRPTVGMTGEVTLSGRVLPIGGVKQKVLAAHRAGLSEVVLPARNGGDLDDVPEAVRQQMTFHLAEDVAQVLEVALEPEAGAPAAAA
ncbi:MAG TPA: endopeptidase La [Acidimicrobiales bacterium]|nr:endopeptidase La [Acidimicrobiales bacterium]